MNSGTTRGSGRKNGVTKMRNNDEKALSGMSKIELIIVLGVLAFLAAIIIPCLLPKEMVIPTATRTYFGVIRYSAEHIPAPPEARWEVVYSTRVSEEDFFITQNPPAPGNGIFEFHPIGRKDTIKVQLSKDGYPASIAFFPVRH